jgi:hypothetical protein
MKRQLLFFTILFLGLKCYSQDFLTQPDGITFSYSCDEKDSLSKTIFVGQKHSVYTFQANHKTITSIKINNQGLLMELAKLLTFDFINKLKNCYGSVDSRCCYFLMRKKGKKYDYIVLDIRLIDNNNCEQKQQLSRLIDILNIISG